MINPIQPASSYSVIVCSHDDSKYTALMKNLENAFSVPIEVIRITDARSPAEYNGEKLYAARGGHIPGAVNIEWTDFMDPGHNLRLRTIAELRSLLEEKGFGTDKTVVAYCHTHHRSAHTWFVLKYLGYHARGYEGSWSDWGNREDTPIEV